MSVLNTIAAFLNKPKASFQTSTGSVILDAAVSETHTTSATITSHPVESGANITDHVHREPDSLTIQGVVSNTSTDFPLGTVGVALVRTVANLVNGVSNDLAKTAYDQLRALVDGKELVKIVTTLRTYDNMLIENLTVNRDARYGDALNFTATARQVRLIKTSSAEKSAVPAPSEPKKAVKKSLGNQSKQAVPAPQVPDSTLLQTTNFFNR